MPYLRLHEQLALARRFGEIAGFSADLSGLAHPAPLSLASLVLTSTGNAEQLLFPGFAAVALIAIAAAGSLSWGGDASAMRRRLMIGFALLACGFLAVALIAHSGRPWAVRVGGTTIVSVTTALKPLTAAIWCGLFAIAASGPLARARSSRSAFAFYVVAAAAMYVLSFGPRPSFHGTPFWYRAPYAWLMELPGFENVRAPARFAMLAQLCLAAAAALALVKVRDWLPATTRGRRDRRRDRGRARGRLDPLAAAGEPAGAFRLARIAEWRRGRRSCRWTDMVAGIAALYRSIDYHRRPTVNGYSGFVPNHYQVLRAAIDADGMEAFDAITPYASAPPSLTLERHDRRHARRNVRPIRCRQGGRCRSTR